MIVQLKTNVMLTTTDVARLYDTILSIPGMNDTVKLELKITRKNILLLDQVIAKGLNGKEGEEATSLLDLVSPEVAQELSALSADCLQKAGLITLSEKLKAFHE
jgi:hypothetical protein